MPIDQANCLSEDLVNFGRSCLVNESHQGPAPFGWAELPWSDSPLNGRRPPPEWGPRQKKVAGLARRRLGALVYAAATLVDTVVGAGATTDVVAPGTVLGAAVVEGGTVVDAGFAPVPTGAAVLGAGAMVDDALG